MSISLQYGQSCFAKALMEDGTFRTFDLSTHIAQISPQLAIPSWIDLVSNKSIVGVPKWGNVQFRALAKNGPEFVYKNGVLVKDPSIVEKNDIQIDIVQLTPNAFMEKAKINMFDLETEGLENILSIYASNWLNNIKIYKEELAINSLIMAAQNYQRKILQENNAYDTFSKGAHVEKSNIESSQQAFNLIKELIYNINSLGLLNAKTKLDKSYRFASGIALQDVAILCSYEFLINLCSFPGLFSSDSGLELFKNMGIRKILGVDFIPISTMPIGVNFVAVTVGVNGALAKMPIGKGTTIVYGNDSNDLEGKILQMTDRYILGVVHNARIWVHMNADVEISEFKFRNKVGLSSALGRVEENFGEPQYAIPAEDYESTFSKVDESVRSKFRK